MLPCRLSPLCALVLLAALTLPACAVNRLALVELPPHPIAIMYWEPEEARRRAEIIAESQAQPPQAVGVARLSHLGAVFGLYDPRLQYPNRARWPGHLSLVDPRTGEISRVEAATPGSKPLAWSLDGRRLLFASAPFRGRNQLFEYDLDSAVVSRISPGEGSAVAAAYGSERRVVYALAQKVGRELSMSLYLTGPYVSAPKLLSDSVATDALTWSPLGSPLVYVDRGPKQGRRAPMMVARDAIMDAEEKNLGPGRDPVFTPDGEWIVYSSPVGDGWRLRRMRPDGSGRTRIGSGQRDELEPAVSPDSGYVAYVGRDANEVERLYVRRMDGSGDRVLISTGSVSSPTW